MWNINNIKHFLYLLHTSSVHLPALLSSTFFIIYDIHEDTELYTLACAQGAY